MITTWLLMVFVHGATPTLDRVITVHSPRECVVLSSVILHDPRVVSTMCVLSNGVRV